MTLSIHGMPNSQYRIAGVNTSMLMRFTTQLINSCSEICHIEMAKAETTNSKCRDVFGHHCLS